MNCIYIYNPNSGKGKSKKNIDYIVKKLRSKYEQVDTYATVAPKDMTRKLSEVASLYDTVVFSGGDGTFNEVVQAIAPLQKKPNLAYIPTGTVNDIAHTLQIPRRRNKAIKLILNGNAKSVDCMKINDNYAMYVVCAGYFTKATYSTPQKTKKVFGKIAYAVEGVTKNFAMPNFHLQVYDKNDNIVADTDCALVLVINSKSVAGFRVNSNGSLVDESVEVAIIKQSTPSTHRGKLRSFLALVKLFLFGYKIREKHIIRFSGTHFEFKTSDDVIWNYDGEKGQNGNITLDVIPSGVSVILKKNIKNL